MEYVIFQFSFLLLLLLMLSDNFCYGSGGATDAATARVVTSFTLRKPTSSFLENYLQKIKTAMPPLEFNHAFVGCTRPSMVNGADLIPGGGVLLPWWRADRWRHRTFLRKLGEGAQVYRKASSVVAEWRVHQGSTWAAIVVEGGEVATSKGKQAGDGVCGSSESSNGSGGGRTGGINTTHTRRGDGGADHRKDSRSGGGSRTARNLVTVARSMLGLWVVNPCREAYPPCVDTPIPPIEHTFVRPLHAYGDQMMRTVADFRPPDAVVSSSRPLPGGICTASAYATLRGHLLEGEERVRVMWFNGKSGDDSVWVEVYSVSRGSGWRGALLFSLIGAMQGRFFEEQVSTVKRLAARG